VAELVTRERAATSAARSDPVGLCQFSGFARSAVDVDAVSAARRARRDFLDQPRIVVGIVEGAERP
jgi:hypothetical protein